jgi:glycosyltransferase involved in cell wall biosynthesis
MSLGHPASSMSEAIDYVMLQSCHADSPHHFSETVLVRAGTGRHAPFARNLPAPLPTRPLRASGEPLHIAVNSALKKLSHRLLAVCLQLDREAVRPLHFHFFPYGKDLALTDLEWQLRRQLRAVSVHSQTDYPSYLQALAGCDLALASFPFGNTNSTVDAAMLGIPVVAFEGDEPLSLGDRRVLRDLDAPGWLLARNEQDYKDAALRLLNDDALRLQIGTALQQRMPRLFGHDASAQQSDFGDAVRWMYAHHEAIQASGRRVLGVGDSLD